MTAWRWAAIPMTWLLVSAAVPTAAHAQPAGVGPACATTPGAPTSTPPSSSPPPGPAPRVAPLSLPALPLRTAGNRIVDRHHAGVILASANWYGAEERDYIVGGLDRRPLATIARQVRAAGFNSVRLPWSNALVHDNPVVCDSKIGR